MRAYKNSSYIQRVRRCSRPLCSSQRTTRHHPHAPARPTTPRRGRRRYEKQDGPEPRQHPHPHGGGPFPQDPTACLRTGRHARDSVPRTPEGDAVLGARNSRPAELVSVPPSSTTPHTRRPPGMGTDHGLGAALDHSARGWRPVLLRKEVIQPHLPVRLPCYDFVPIADPAFDGSLPQGVGPPASGVTDFRDVTGGVYKARERIHRSVADLRLLATPTSWGRVADPNPN